MLGMNSKDKGVWGQQTVWLSENSSTNSQEVWTVKTPFTNPGYYWVKEQKQQLLPSAESNQYGKWGQRSKAPSWVSWMAAATQEDGATPHLPEACLWGTSPSGSPMPPTYSWKQTDFRSPASNLNPVSKQLQVYIEWTAQPGVSTAGTNTQE